MARQTYILKPKIRKTNDRYGNHDVFDVNFILYNKDHKEVVIDNVNCFEGLDIVGVDKKTFKENIVNQLSKQLQTAKEFFESEMFCNKLLGRYEPSEYKMKQKDTQIIFSF